MSAGITALGWAAIVGVTAATVSSADTARKAGHAQTDAINNQMASDARATAEAQTGAAVAANAMRVGQKRAYQANTLALGSGDGTKNVLAAGASTAQRQAGVQPTVSVLGGGAPVVSGGR
jgi:hypothetical protein